MGKGKYKDTLSLPATDFPMRGSLATREPEFLAAWKNADIYRQILELRADAEPYVLHDGPPYANHNIHHGHILNKTLKDMVVKYKSMAGFRCPYIPGWDTHGLPIELEVAKELGKKKRDMSKLEIRQACRDYALKYVDVQREEFERLGVFGDWQNPYLTLDASYEVAIIRALAAFARGGFLYRGKKPVYWCPSCATALAEAEIEYDEAHVSPSIFVRLPLETDPGSLAPALAGKSLSLVIWTTTPWTIPANLAVVASPSFEYVAVPSTGANANEGEYWLLAKELAAKTIAATGGAADESWWIAIDRDKMATLEGARYHHPFVEPPRGANDFKLWFADYVTLEQGTGLVHTAPGHGTDDYKTGVTHGLEAYAPIDAYGKFTDDVPRWAGKKTGDANPLITEALFETGYLINPSGQTVTHKYPVCWRCKKPVLFRATDQWFIKIDHGALRERALTEIEATTWVPPWGETRINGMIANRPDWVLSRQRLWGVPIPAFYCMACETAHADADVMEHVAEIVAKEGSDAWYARTPAELLPPGFACSECGGTEFRAEDAIVDVWFESGTSWLAMAARDDDHKDIDLYLEGSDQHRGWFHSSLLVGIGVAGKAPYKTVITHGFVLDENGNPYSKSAIKKAQAAGKKTKYTPPEQVIATSGAEMLRLWVASIEFRNDMPFSETLLARLSDWYRKLRNTLKFTLGTLSDFDPNAHNLENVELTELDRYALARLGDVVAKIREAYDKFEFHLVHRSLVDYVTTELSSFYLDVLKDRLYTDAPDAPRRRAAQAVLHTITRTLALLTAPILCFTAEDVWNHLPRRDGDLDSVHLAKMPAGKRIADGDALVARYATLLRYREIVLAALEPFRAEKHRSEDAEVVITALEADAELLRSCSEELADLCIVSSVVIEATDTGEPSAAIRDAPGQRCLRCWRYFVEMSAGNQELCVRCAGALDARASS